jgi:hypothetical protein
LISSFCGNVKGIGKLHDSKKAMMPMAKMPHEAKQLEA